MDRDLRREYEKSRERNLTDYWLSIGQEFTYSINRLSKLIGNAHELSTGRYKERLLIDLISNFIPRKYSIGTGFILFPTMTFSETGVISDHQMSGELDIIIYDSTNYSTIFKDKDIVVLRPESVRVIIEVKGALNYNQKDDFMNKFIDLYQKWKSVDALYQEMGNEKLRCPKLFVMNWNTAIDAKSGKPIIKGENLPNLIVKAYKEKLGENINTQFPYINAVLIYNSSKIEFCYHVDISGIQWAAYAFRSGRITSNKESSNIDIDIDTTIAYLLSSIDWYLDSPSNTLITNPTINNASSDIIEKWFPVDLK